MHLMQFWCFVRPEEGIRFLELELQTGLAITEVLGINGPSQRATGALNCCTIFSTLSFDFKVSLQFRELYPGPCIGHTWIRLSGC